MGTTRERSSGRTTAARSGPGSGRTDSVQSRGNRRRWWAPAALGVVTVLVLAVYFTPVLGVRSVEVLGASSLSRDEVVRTSGVQVGEPMLRVDGHEAADALRGMPKIASARVERVWPSTVRLRIVERTPMAFAVQRGGFQLVDAEGVRFAEVPERPAGLPELRVRAVPESGDPSLRAALSAVRALSPDLRGQVLAVEAPTPEQTRLLLTENRLVRWGSVDESEHKAAILSPLLSRPGRVYDVTSPALPTVS